MTSAQEPTSSYTEPLARSRFSAIRYVACVISLHLPFLTQKKTKTSGICQSHYCNRVIVCPQGAERKMRDEERKKSKRREKTNANSECCRQPILKIMSSSDIHTVYKHSLRECILTCCFCFSVNKSLVSSSMGSECTFFQTLDDHITQPVLFIPETHLSSLQRMVGPPLTLSSPLLVSCLE